MQYHSAFLKCGTPFGLNPFQATTPTTPVETKKQQQQTTLFTDKKTVSDYDALALKKIKQNQTAANPPKTNQQEKMLQSGWVQCCQVQKNEEVSQNCLVFKFADR